jgi:hypothetical protein
MARHATALTTWPGTTVPLRGTRSGIAAGTGNPPSISLKVASARSCRDHRLLGSSAAGEPAYYSCRARSGGVGRTYSAVSCRWYPGGRPGAAKEQLSFGLKPDGRRMTRQGQSARLRWRGRAPRSDGSQRLRREAGERRAVPATAGRARRCGWRLPTRSSSATQTGMAARRHHVHARAHLTTRPCTPSFDDGSGWAASGFGPPERPPGRPIANARQRAESVVLVFGDGGPETLLGCLFACAVNRAHLGSGRTPSPGFDHGGDLQFLRRARSDIRAWAGRTSTASGQDATRAGRPRTRCTPPGLAACSGNGSSRIDLPGRCLTFTRFR